MPARPEDPQDAAPLSKADLALEQATVVLAPLVRWMLRSGVNWVALSQALKPVFVQEGRRELRRTGGKITDSALSVLSGVHRKDLRALGAAGAPARSRFAVPPAARVAARWLADPACHEGGRTSNPPLERLPRHGPAPSFEALARQVCSDVNPQTLLDEMVRLGLVRVDGDQVVLVLPQLSPEPGDRGTAAVAAANTADHLAAAVHNLTTPGPRFLEQSLFAHGLTQESTAELACLARELWRPALQSMVDAASARVQADREAQATPMRMRFGIYYYEDRQDDNEQEDRPAADAPQRAARAKRGPASTKPAARRRTGRPK
jgi:hypothetical protein